MGQSLTIRKQLINKEYDLHGLRVTYTKALEREDYLRAQVLKSRMLVLKEEINSLSELLRFPRARN